MARSLFGILVVLHSWFSSNSYNESRQRNAKRRQLNQTPIYQNTHHHLHCPVRVKADQKKGFEKSLDRNRFNCASRHACTRCSPARHRRTNSVINALVAVSLTFQWLASTV